MYRRIRQCGTGVKRPDVPPSRGGGASPPPPAVPGSFLLMLW